MNKLRLAAIPTIFALVGCASTPSSGLKEPMVAASECAQKAGEPFGPEGHLYTTLTIAKIAGYDTTRQFTLAYFSQYPDLDKNYAAAFVAVKYLLFPWKLAWRNKITGVLHSLHGGAKEEIFNRRNKIRSVILKTLPDPQMDWLTGLLIHSYGDAFAHTQGEYSSTEEVAYGEWLGHAIPTLLGDDPDDITNSSTRKKYLAYVVDLYGVIKTSNADDEEFKNFLEFITALKSQPSFHPDFHTLKASDDKLSNIMSKFSTCVSSNARRLSEQEILRAINLIIQD